MKARKPLAEIALLVVCAFWGTTFLMVKNALPAISPLLFLALRFALATAVLLVVYRRKLVRQAILPGAFTGLFLFGGYAFQTIGLQTTTASKSAFLTSFSVPMVPFVSWLVYRNRPRTLDIVGVVIASAGMLLLTVPHRIVEISRGDWLSVFCAVSFAAQIVVLSHFAKHGGFETLAITQMATVTLLALATFWWVEIPWFQPTSSAVFAILFTGLFATALAFSLQAWGQQYTSVTRAAVIYSLEPVFAWLAGFLTIRETLTPRGTLGAVLIICGILVAELKRVEG